MKKLVYTVQGFARDEQQELLCSLLPDVLRAYGSDGKVEADPTSASVSFCVPRNIDNGELEQSLNAVLAEHEMQLLPPPGVRYYAYVGPQKRPQKGISTSTFVASLISAVSITLVVTMLLTAIFSSAYWNNKRLDGMLGEVNADQEASEIVDEKALALINRLIREYSLMDVDSEALMDSVMRAYVEATGDEYALYYNEEEYAEKTSNNEGNMVGIGVSVAGAVWENQTVIYVAMPYPGSPAVRAGIKTGDLIAAIKQDGQIKTIDELGGYDAALSQLKGDPGTRLDLIVMRYADGAYHELEFSIVREAFTTDSVVGKVSTTDPTVGVVHILQFDLTTPEQLEAAIDDLLAKGCTKFVMDVRSNPGGDLASVVAVLSYFLEEGELILSTKDKAGNVEETFTEIVKYSGSYAACDVTKDEIGKYKDLNLCVLTNGNTASAAELFSATIRDYEMGALIGTRTYGKGSVQRVYDLEKWGSIYKIYGVKGAVKLTHQMYFPACGESYHGIGIAPDIELDLPEELKGRYSFYDLEEELDIQLLAAIDHLK